MMHSSLFSRLFFACLISSVVVAISMAVSTQFSFQSGFIDYLQSVDDARLQQLIPVLKKAYTENGHSWQFLQENRHAWRKLLAQSLGEVHARQMPQTPPRLPPNKRHDEREYPPPPKDTPDDPDFLQHEWREHERHERDHPEHEGPHEPLSPFALGVRIRLLDSEKVALTGPLFEPSKDERLLPITLDERVIAWISVHSLDIQGDHLAASFLAQQSRLYYVIALLAVLSAALGSFFIARQLLHPIKQIAEAAQALGTGHYQTRVSLSGCDELRQLAEDFNSLARALEHHEQSRRQWIADISHELRTPLAILGGEIEAIQDGIRPLSLQALKSLQMEVLNLGKLVDDLYQLTLSDSGALDYRKECIDVVSVLDNVVTAFQARFRQQHLRLENYGTALESLHIWADERRLTQLFNNLLENSVRYTDAGGGLQIHGECLPHCVRLRFEDTAPAVPEDALPHLFERLYRVDKSRSRALGGAGLGLAICHNIVTAHEGKMSAYHAKTGGLGILIEFTLAKSE